MNQLRTLAATLVLSGASLAAQPQRITFPDAVQRALARNPSVLVALEEISRAHGIMREVRSGAIPTLNATGVYTRLDADRTTVAATLDPNNVVTNQVRTVQPRDSWIGSLQLAVPLIAPQRWVQWAHAAEQVDVARLSAEDVRRQVGVTTARTYVSVLAAHRLVEANQHAADNARDHLEDAKARLAVGSGNRLDLVRASQELATSESLRQAALTALIRTQETLGVLVGSDAPLDSTDDMQFPPMPAPAEAIDDAEQRRADIQAQRKRAEAAQHVVRDSYADYLPFLTGIAQPFASSYSSLTSPTSGWQAQLVLTLPLYDGGFRYGALEQRRAERDQAREILDAALREARSEVRSGFEALERADLSLAQAREASRLAGEALDITTLSYHAGASNDLDVVDAQRRARDADNAAAIAEDAARQARIDLLSATGRFP